MLTLTFFPTHLPPNPTPSHFGPPCADGDGNEAWIIQSSELFSVDSALKTARPGRKRGRPSKPKFEGPRRPQGRPKGSGKLQGTNGGIESKKRQGRPLKEKNMGGVTIDYNVVSKFFSY